MTIREYAKQNNHLIVGKLTLKETSKLDGVTCYCYTDEAGNEYYKSCRGCAIATIEGAVI